MQEKGLLLQTLPVRETFAEEVKFRTNHFFLRQGVSVIQDISTRPPYRKHPNYHGLHESYLALPPTASQLIPHQLSTSRPLDHLTAHVLKFALQGEGGRCARLGSLTWRKPGKILHLCSTTLILRAQLFAGGDVSSGVSHRE